MYGEQVKKKIERKRAYNTRDWRIALKFMFYRWSMCQRLRLERIAYYRSCQHDAWRRKNISTYYVKNAYVVFFWERKEQCVLKEKKWCKCSATSSMKNHEGQIKILERYHAFDWNWIRRKAPTLKMICCSSVEEFGSCRIRLWTILSPSQPN